MVTGYKWTPVPISTKIIERIHQLAHNQPEGISFEDDDDFSGVEEHNSESNSENNKDKTYTAIEELPGVLIESSDSSDEDSNSESSDSSDNNNDDDDTETKTITTQQLENELMSNLDTDLEEINEINYDLTTKIEAYEDKMEKETPP